MKHLSLPIIVILALLVGVFAPTQKAIAGVGDPITITIGNVTITGSITAESPDRITIGGSVSVPNFGTLRVSGLVIDASDWQSGNVTVVTPGTVGYEGAGPITLGGVTLSNFGGAINQQGFTGRATISIEGASVSVILSIDANGKMVATISNGQITVGGVSITNISGTITSTGVALSGKVAIEGGNQLTVSFSAQSGVVEASITNATFIIDNLQITNFNGTFSNSGLTGSGRISVEGNYLDFNYSITSNNSVINVTNGTITMGQVTVSNIQGTIDVLNGLSASGTVSTLGTTLHFAFSTDNSGKVSVSISGNTVTIGNVTVTNFTGSLTNAGFHGTGTILIGLNAVTVEFTSIGGNITASVHNGTVVVDGLTITNINGTLSSSGFSAMGTFTDNQGNTITVSFQSDASGNITWSITNGTLIIGDVVISNLNIDSNGNGSGTITIGNTATVTVALTKDPITKKYTATLTNGSAYIGNVQLTNINATITESAGFQGTGKITIGSNTVTISLASNGAGKITGSITDGNITIGKVNISDVNINLTDSGIDGSGTITVGSDFLSVYFDSDFSGNITIGVSNGSMNIGNVLITNITGSMNTSTGNFVASGTIAFEGNTLNVAFSTNTSTGQISASITNSSIVIGSVAITNLNLSLDSVNGVSGSGTITLTNTNPSVINVAFSTDFNGNFSITADATILLVGDGHTIHLTGSFSNGKFSATGTYTDANGKVVSVTFTSNPDGTITWSIHADEIVIGGVVIHDFNLNPNGVDGWILVGGDSVWVNVAVDANGNPISATFTTPQLHFGNVLVTNFTGTINSTGLHGSGTVNVEGVNLTLTFHSDPGGHIWGSLQTAGPITINGVNITNINITLNENNSFSGTGTISIEGFSATVTFSTDAQGNVQVGITNGTIQIGNLSITNVNIQFNPFSASGNISLPALGGTVGLAFTVSNGGLQATLSLTQITIAGFVISNASIDFDSNGNVVINGQLQLPDGGTASVSALTINSTGIVSGTISLSNVNIGGFAVLSGSATLATKPNRLIISASIDLSSTGIINSVSVSNLVIDPSGNIISCGPISITGLNIAGFSASGTIELTETSIIIHNATIDLTALGGGSVTVSEIIFDKNGNIVSMSAIEVHGLHIGQFSVDGSAQFGKNPNCLIITGTISLDSIGSLTVTGLKIAPDGTILDMGSTGIDITIGAFHIGGNVTINGNRISVDAKVTMPYFNGEIAGGIVLEKTTPGGGVLGTGYNVISGYLNLPEFTLGGYTIAGATFQFDQQGIRASTSIKIPNIGPVEGLGISLAISWNGDLLEACLTVQGNIPLGTTGLVLDEVGGCLYHYTTPEHWVVTLTARIGMVNGDLLAVEGTLTIDTVGKISGLGTLEVVSFPFGSASFEVNIPAKTFIALAWLGEDPNKGFEAPLGLGYLRGQINLQLTFAPFTAQGGGQVALKILFFNEWSAEAAFRYGTSSSRYAINVYEGIPTGDGLMAGVDLGGDVWGAMVKMNPYDFIIFHYDPGDLYGKVVWLDNPQAKAPANQSAVGSVQSTVISNRLSVIGDETKSIDNPKSEINNLKSVLPAYFEVQATHTSAGAYQLISTGSTPTVDAFVDIFGNPKPGVVRLSASKVSNYYTIYPQAGSYVLAYGWTGTNYLYSSVKKMGGSTRVDVSWVTTPPSTFNSGETKSVAWKITGGTNVSETNVHYGTNPDPRTNYTLSSPVQSGGMKTYFSTVNVNTTNTAKYYFVVYSKVDGVDYYSDIVNSTVQGSSTLVQVDWQTKPPASINSGSQMNLVWKITGGTNVSHTNIHYGKNPDPRTNSTSMTTVQKGTPGTYSAIVTLTTSVRDSFYFTAHAQVDAKDYYSTIEKCVVVNPNPVSVTFTNLPTGITGNVPFTVSWKINGGTKVNYTTVRYGTDPNPKEKYTGTTGSQSGVPGNYSGSITINTTTQATYYFVVYAIVDNVYYYSTIESRNVSAGQPITVTMNQLPTTITSGQPFTVNWSVANAGGRGNLLGVDTEKLASINNRSSVISEQLSVIGDEVESIDNPNDLLATTISHTNIHYGTNPDPRMNYTGATTVQTGGFGNYSASVTVRTTNDANFYFVAHAVVYGLNYYSAVQQRSVKGSGGGGSASVEWVTPPPSLSVSWKLTGGTKTTHTNVHWGNNPDPRMNYTGSTSAQSGPSNTTYSAVLPMNASGYFVAHAIIDGVNYYSNIVGPYTPALTVRTPEAPDTYALMQNYPNPFNPETVIGYQLAVGSNVELRIYSVTGQLIRTLVNEEQSAGYYNVKWDGKDDRGNEVAGGIYIYTIKAGEFSATKRMIMVK